MDNFLEDIRLLEQGGFIKTTREYIGTRKINSYPPLASKEFKPAILFKTLVLLLPLTIFAIALIKTFQPKSLTNAEIGGTVAGYICSFIIGANVIRQFFIDKTMNFKIKVDNFGISINDTLYKWDNIYDTAIMKKFAGGSVYKYLVIALDNMSTYECFDLTNFVNLNPFGFSMTLAKYIEYFKHTENNKTKFIISTTK